MKKYKYKYNMTTIDVLPAEIMEMILDKTSYYITRLVCKYWDDVVGNKKNGIIGITSQSLYQYFQRDLHFSKANVTTEAMLEENMELINFMYNNRFCPDTYPLISIINYFKKKNSGSFKIIHYYQVKIPYLIQDIIKSGPTLFSLGWLEDQYQSSIKLDWAIHSRNIENIKYLKQYHSLRYLDSFINFIQNHDLSIFEILDVHILRKFRQFFIETFLVYDFLEGIEILCDSEN